MIIDTHLHVIDQSAMRYPWLSGAPALNRDFSYEEYAREAKRVASEAVRDGLRAIGAGAGPVDVLGLARVG